MASIPDTRISSAKTTWLVVWCTVVLAGLLLFSRLGHYALWDDEAGTALTAKSILRNGDSLVFVDDHNILAYRQGSELQGAKLRYVPPLSFYVVSATMWVTGRDTAFWCRLPFALLGVATVALLMLWGRERGCSPSELAIFAVGLLSNVTLLLYARQCRYYALAIFLSVAAAYLYMEFRQRTSQVTLLLLVSLLLLATNYLTHFALYACMAADYVLFRRKELRITWRQLLLLSVPQTVFGAVVVSIWNPFIRAPGVPPQNSAAEKLVLFARQWFYLNTYEMLCAGMVVLAVALAWKTKNRLLIRALIAVAAYVTAVTALSPQRVAQTSDAAMRYVLPVLLLGTFISTFSIDLVSRGRRWLAPFLALAAFGTNLLHGGPALASGLRSTIACYVRELVHPVPDPYSAAARWINAQLPAGATIWAVPDHTAYPLMFHAPQATYAWQLPATPPEALRQLPPIHFNGMEPPRYIIVFGPFSPLVLRKVAPWQPYGIRYRLREVIDCFWEDGFRPELILHRFVPHESYDRSREAIYIFELEPH